MVRIVPLISFYPRCTEGARVPRIRVQISREQIASGAVFCRLKIRALSFPFHLCEKKRKKEKKAPLFNCTVANSIHFARCCLSSPSWSLLRFLDSVSQIKKSSFALNSQRADRFIDSVEFLNNKEYFRIIFGTQYSTLCSNEWNGYGLFTPMRGTFILTKSGPFIRSFGNVETRDHIKAILIHYRYIYILVAISRARYTVSSDVTWRVAQKTGCQWLEISIITRADILQIPE